MSGPAYRYHLDVNDGPVHWWLTKQRDYYLVVSPLFKTLPLSVHAAGVEPAVVERLCDVLWSALCDVAKPPPPVGRPGDVPPPDAAKGDRPHPFCRLHDACRTFDDLRTMAELSRVPSALLGRVDADREAVVPLPRYRTGGSLGDAKPSGQKVGIATPSEIAARLKEFFSQAPSILSVSLALRRAMSVGTYPHPEAGLGLGHVRCRTAGRDTLDGREIRRLVRFLENPSMDNRFTVKFRFENGSPVVVARSGERGTVSAVCQNRRSTESTYLVEMVDRTGVASERWFYESELEFPPQVGKPVEDRDDPKN